MVLFSIQMCSEILNNIYGYKIDVTSNCLADDHESYTML